MTPLHTAPYGSRPVSAPKQPSPYRLYRVTLYALFLAFTLAFIGAIIWGVYSDLYRKPEDGVPSASTPTACIDEADALARKLDALSVAAFRTGSSDWLALTGEFDRRFSTFQDRCLGNAAPSDPAGLATALQETADHLDEYRRHLARCGEEGARERAAVSAALAALRQASIGP